MFDDDNSPPYLSTPEAAKIARFSKAKIRQLIVSGKLAAVDTSAGDKRPRWSIRLADLEAFLTPQSVAKAEAKQSAVSTARRQRIDSDCKRIYG